MPTSLRLTVGLVLVAAGIALTVIAVLGARAALRRNRWAGVRTTASLSSDAAFTLANRVAAVPLGAGGVVAAAGGAVVLAGAGGVLATVVLAVSVIGALVLVGLGGVLGDRAAATVEPEPVAAPGCAGVCAGCDLVAGCRDATATP